MDLSLIADFLDENRDHLTGLTSKKVYQRGVLLDKESDGSRIVFEVERHKGILGAQYSPGVAMSAFITQWIKYEFDGKEINEIGYTRPAEIGDIDYYGLAKEHVFDMSFGIEKNEDGIFNVSEVCSKSTGKYDSLDKVPEFANRMAQDLDLSFLMGELSEYLSIKESENVILKLQKEIETLLREKLEDAVRDFKKDL